MSKASAFLVLLLGAGCASGPDWPGPSRPYKGVVRTIPGLIEAEDFDEGELLHCFTKRK